MHRRRKPSEHRECKGNSNFILEINLFIYFSSNSVTQRIDDLAQGLDNVFWVILIGDE